MRDGDELLGLATTDGMRAKAVSGGALLAGGGTSLLVSGAAAGAGNALARVPTRFAPSGASHGVLNAGSASAQQPVLDAEQPAGQRNASTQGASLHGANAAAAPRASEPQALACSTAIPLVGALAQARMNPVFSRSASALLPGRNASDRGGQHCRNDSGGCEVELLPVHGGARPTSASLLHSGSLEERNAGLDGSPGAGAGRRISRVDSMAHAFAAGRLDGRPTSVDVGIHSNCSSSSHAGSGKRAASVGGSGGAPMLLSMHATLRSSQRHALHGCLAVLEALCVPVRALSRACLACIQAASSSHGMRAGGNGAQAELRGVRDLTLKSVLLDMGFYEWRPFLALDQDASPPGGESAVEIVHVMQVLPEKVAARVLLFPPLVPQEKWTKVRGTRAGRGRDPPAAPAG
eukprot:366340-Chlamydomonas_euryale.AAC.12